MRQLRDRDDLRVAVDAGYEGVLGQLTHAGREGQEVLRRELLVAEEHDLVLEPGPADGRHGVVIEVGQVDPTDDGAERAGDRRDGELAADRKSGVEGKRVSLRVSLGGRGRRNKKNTIQQKR